MIATASNTVVGSPIPTNSVPLGIAATPDGQFVYVALNGQQSVGIISTATNTMTSTVASVGTSPFAIAISSNGQYAYVTNQGSSSVAVINLLDDVSQTAPDTIQEVPRPITGCASFVSDSSVNWAGVSGIGWTPSWAQWVDDGHGGEVCVRLLSYNTNTGTWFVR
ncbi:unannotated protein [freshwater metagenome]|uniref:Unannotated protein n=1 Tax=freshwater metagenome TaxID=449393 RepID=A0A6J7QZQ8_9ZZZZ